MDAFHVYMGACTLGCFHSLISTQTFRRVLTALVDSCAEIKECHFSGVTKSGRVWRKVPESDALLWHFLSPETLQIRDAEALLSSDFRNTVVTSGSALQ